MQAFPGVQGSRSKSWSLPTPRPSALTPSARFTPVRQTGFSGVHTAQILCQAAFLCTDREASWPGVQGDR